MLFHSYSIAVLGYGASRLYLQNTQSSDVVGHQSLANDGNKVVTKEEGDIANVVDRVGPSVVSIVTTATVNARFGLLSKRAQVRE